jgi:hypothetical protein
VRHDAVDDADAEEADHHQQAAGDRRGLVAAHLLQPTNVLLNVRADSHQRIKVLAGTPGQEDP